MKIHEGKHTIKGWEALPFIYPCDNFITKDRDSLPLLPSIRIIWSLYELEMLASVSLNLIFCYFFQVLAIPAIPLTMSAGLLFGSVTGTIIVSISGTVSFCLSFIFCIWQMHVFYSY